MRVLQSHELDLIGGGRRYVHHSVSKHSSVKIDNSKHNNFNIDILGHFHLF